MIPSSDDSGIIFQDITFGQALAKAKNEKKFIFMNVYADSCAPCTNLKETDFLVGESRKYIQQ